MKENFKVCFFIGSMYLGGIGKLSIYLMQYFISRGVKVDLFLMKKGGEYIQDIPKEVQVIFVEGSYLKRILTFIKYLKRNKPMISFSARERQNIINYFCCKLSFTKVEPIVSFHAINPSEDMSQKNILISFLAKLTYKSCKKLIAVSEAVKKNYINRYNIKSNKIKVIYNPSYFPRQQVNKHREKKIIDKFGSKYLVSIGRLKEIKDLPTLIEGFSIYQEKDKDIKLLILGDGPEKNKLKQLIESKNLSNNIFLLGYVSNTQEYLKNALALILTSKSEGFGNVIVESLGQGTTVISTTCGGPEEILNFGEFGYLMPIESPVSLSLFIEKAIKEPFNKEKLIERAQDFSTNEICEVYYNYFFHETK